MRKKKKEEEGVNWNLYCAVAYDAAEKSHVRQEYVTISGPSF